MTEQEIDRLFWLLLRRGLLLLCDAEPSDPEAWRAIRRGFIMAAKAIEAEHLTEPRQERTAA